MLLRLSKNKPKKRTQGDKEFGLKSIKYRRELRGTSQLNHDPNNNIFQVNQFENTHVVLPVDLNHERKCFLVVVQTWDILILWASYLTYS